MLLGRNRVRHREDGSTEESGAQGARRRARRLAAEARGEEGRAELRRAGASRPSRGQARVCQVASGRSRSARGSAWEQVGVRGRLQDSALVRFLTHRLARTIFPRTHSTLSSCCIGPPAFSSPAGRVTSEPYHSA